MVFCLSAFLKLFPIEYFEVKISQFVFADTLVPAVLARLIIAFEFFLGLFLIFQIHFNKIIIKLTLYSLFVFLVINVIDIIKHGPNGNCGCFGMEYSVTPVESAIKNVVLLVLVFISNRKTSFELIRPKKYIGFISLALCMGTVFIFSPIYVSALNTSELEGTKLDLGIIDGHRGLKGKNFKDDLTEGKKVVAFVSLTCNFCKLGGYKLSLLKQDNPELPVFFIINGDSSNMNAFYKASNTRGLPAMHFNGSNDYLKLSGSELPAIYLLENAVVYRKFNAMSLNGSEIMEWYNKKRN